MKSILIVTMLLATFTVNASSKIVVKLGRDTKNLKTNVQQLKKELAVIDARLGKLNNTLAIPSHAAGEVKNLQRSLKRAKEVSMITDLMPSLKGKGEMFRKDIENIESSVNKAQEISENASIQVVAFHKEVRSTKWKVGKIRKKVNNLIKSGIPRFYSGMTGAQDCVYKSEQTKRECMQDELNSAADDLSSTIGDSNKKVLALIETAGKLKEKVAELQQTLKRIFWLIKPIQQFEYHVHKQILPFLDLYKLMHKDFEVRYLIPEPYTPKKKKWFYVKVSGKDIILGMLHTMDEIEKKLKGELLSQANKASVKNLARTLMKALDKDVKNVLKRLNLRVNFKVKSLSTLYKLDSTLLTPLGELSDIMEDVKLEFPTPKAVTCKKLKQECRS